MVLLVTHRYNESATEQPGVHVYEIFLQKLKTHAWSLETFTMVVRARGVAIGFLAKGGNKVIRCARKFVG